MGAEDKGCICKSCVELIGRNQVWRLTIEDERTDLLKTAFSFLLTMPGQVEHSKLRDFQVLLQRDRADTVSTRLRVLCLDERATVLKIPWSLAIDNLFTPQCKENEDKFRHRYNINPVHWLPCNYLYTASSVFSQIRIPHVRLVHQQWELTMRKWDALNRNQSTLSLLDNMIIICH